MPSRIKWRDEIDPDDVTAAYDYLTLVMGPNELGRIRFDLTQETEHPAKDILRASGLPLLPVDNFHVAGDLDKIRADKPMSPVLLVAGHHGLPLVIADGYHRVCAAYHHDENAMIPASFSIT